jgi:hypothetical protein
MNEEVLDMQSEHQALPWQALLWRYLLSFGLGLLAVAPFLFFSGNLTIDFVDTICVVLLVASWLIAWLRTRDFATARRALPGLLILLISLAGFSDYTLSTSSFTSTLSHNSTAFVLFIYPLLLPSIAAYVTVYRGRSSYQTGQVAIRCGLIAWAGVFAIYSAFLLVDYYQHSQLSCGGPAGYTFGCVNLSGFSVLTILFLAAESVIACLGGLIGVSLRRLRVYGFEQPPAVGKLPDRLSGRL